MTLVGILTNRLTGLIAAPLSVALILALGWQTWSLASARSAIKDRDVTIAEQKSDLTQAHANEALLRQVLVRQNDAVDDLKAKGDALTATAAELQASAERVITANGERTRALTQAKPTHDKCASASALIREFSK